MSTSPYSRKQQIEKELTETIADLADKEAQLEEMLAIVEALRLKVSLFEKLLKTESSESLVEHHRSPSDMLRPEYKGNKLADIISGVLSRSSVPLTPKEIVSLIYHTKTPEEFERARNSLSTEMRSGVKGSNPRWRKVGRFAYVALPNSLLT